MSVQSVHSSRSSFNVHADTQFQGDYSALFGSNRTICSGILHMHSLLNQYLTACIMNHVLLKWVDNVVLFPVQWRDVSNSSALGAIWFRLILLCWENGATCTWTTAMQDSLTTGTRPCNPMASMNVKSSRFWVCSAIWAETSGCYLLCHP